MHSRFSVLFLGRSFKKESWLDFLAQTPVSFDIYHQFPSNLASYDVVVTDPTDLPSEDLVLLTNYVSRGGSCLGLFKTPSSDENLVRLFGAIPVDVGPDCEVRVNFTDHAHPLGVRLPDEFYVSGNFMPLKIFYKDVEVILYADWQYSHLPMLTNHTLENGLAAATTINDFNQPTIQRVLYRLLRRLAGFPYPKNTLGVGLLGYPSSVGDLHAQATHHGTPGLQLKTICDISLDRRVAASGTYSQDGVSVIAESELMQDDPEIDIVIIATPPNSHTRLALQMLESGKHVVLEKPLALTVAETNAMIELALSNNLLVCCHQNRRWDDDYRAIKQAIDDRLIGEVFYIETFIGGYGHPCGYWHSDEGVSGGTTYDWGAHYLDWIMDLISCTVSEITCVRHKRVWYDITNADQEQILLKFKDGRQAEFLHSDLAFIPKPKWYLLGTTGSIVGHWRELTTYKYDPLVYYQSHQIPPAELGAVLTIRRLQGRNQIIEQTLPVQPKLTFPFHFNLADHLLFGEPIAVPIEHTSRVIAVLETAKRSAENSGSIEKVEI